MYLPFLGGPFVVDLPPSCGVWPAEGGSIWSDAASASPVGLSVSAGYTVSGFPPTARDQQTYKIKMPNSTKQIRSKVKQL